MLDSLDINIIKALQKDARTAFADIAKELDVSPGKVQARYNKMRKSGLIKGSTLILNLNTLGTIVVASIGVKAVESDLEEVKNYIKGFDLKDAQVFSWTTFGRYNISTAMFSKNLLEVHKVRQLIKQHPSVLEVSISLTNASREYLEETRTAEYEMVDLEKILKA